MQLTNRRPRRRHRRGHARVEALETRRLLAVVINELVAANTNGLRDQDGEHSDWLELKNTGGAAVNLGGWYLTDESANLTKWQFPSTNLPPGGYLTVFASNKDRRVAGQELHTNFTLDRAGEYLALVQSNGTTIESSYNPFGSSQKDDVSYGVAYGPSTTNVTLLAHGAPVKVFAPTGPSAATDDFWRDITFNDAGWISTTTGVGYDRDDNALDSAFGTELTTGQMPSSQLSMYVRAPFTVTDKDQLTSLTLSMRYDDGFIAYLNGKEVRREGADNTIKPVWNQNSRVNRPDATVLAATNFDLTPYLPELVNGTNVLAIHGMNQSSPTTDFLMDPVLNATRATGSMTGFMANPTPGANNGAGTQGFVGDTHFSVDRGFFTTAFPVAITTDTPGASIRYTLDGSAPTPTYGTTYSGAITISTTTVLRAIAYKSGWVSSNADTETYLFLNDVIHQTNSNVPGGLSSWGHAPPGDWDMDPDIVNSPTYAGTIINDLKALPTVSVVMNWNDLFGASPQGIYSETTAWLRSSNERAMSMEYFTAGGSEQWHLEGAIEVQGGSSDTRWNTDKLSLQLKFKSPYGPTKLDYPVYGSAPFGQSAATRFDSLLLDAQFNYTWTHGNAVQNSVARYLQDQVVSDLQNLASGDGGAAPHGRFVNLYLNGTYWGMYNLHEKPDAGYAAEYYGGNKDDYDVIKNNKTNWADGGLTAVNNYAALLTAAQAVNSDPTNTTKYQTLTNLLDVDKFIDYMVPLYFAGNWDWGSDNWYANRNRVAPGAKWYFHSWDQEHSFQTDDNAAIENPDFNVNTDTTTKNDTAEGGPTAIQQWLMANAEYKLKFADHVQKLLNNGGLLTPAAAQAVYQARATEIDRAIVGESARWGDNRVATPYTRENWVTTTNGVYANFFNASPKTRTQIVLEQFANTANHPGSWLMSQAAPNFSNYGGTVSPGFSLTMSNPGSGTIYYTTDGSDPRLAGGGLSGSAIAYGSAITINSSSQIKARVKNGANWSAIIDATYVVAGSFPVRIVEMNYHPINNAALADEEDQEFIELLNTGSSTVSLVGAQITEFTSTPYVFGSTTPLLGPGQRIVVARNPGVFAATFPGSYTLAPGGYSPANLSNSGERIALLSPVGDVVQDFTFDDVAPWPTSPDGNGPTLVYNGPLNAGENPANGAPLDPFEVGSNWIASPINNGSPGTDGTPPAPIVLSSSFDFEAGHKIVIQFSEDVSASLAAGDLAVTPLGGGSPITPGSYSWNAGTKTVTFSMSPILLDGNYSALLAAGSVDHLGTPLANPTQFEFFVLAGDANRDRHVDSADQAILTANLGQSGTFSQGNFNYAGIIDAADQALLTGAMATWVPSQGPLVLPSSVGADDQRLRIESGTLLDLFLAGAPNGSPNYRILRSAITSLSFAGGSGNDSLALDYSNGSPLPAGGIGIDGGGDNDTLTILGSSSADAVTFAASGITVAGSSAIAHGNVESVAFDGAGGFDTVTATGGPTLLFPATQHLDSLTLSAGASASLVAGANSVLVVNDLTLGAGAILDLADNDFAWDYSTVSPVGTWNGSAYDQLTGKIAAGQIISSSAVGTFKNLGIAEAYQVLGAGGGMFGSESVDGTSALIKYTYVGDATLDGKLNIDDYIRIDLSIPVPMTYGWFNGDFNYDGKLNIDDYVLIDGNIPNYSTPL